ncbi:Cro/CI family transcriptional regulator [Salinicola salarius]|uniref:Cro/CI family transcriptional regulator n=1 Tax=Salinicola salarius TaxID=430457 RepID=UPI0023E3B6AC|nr:Cro/CI family transcriptional regulator [Salinicola salarius]MDF3917490.1 Cro/CI family transcriptional regulator [Salinicola salarius]
MENIFEQLVTHFGTQEKTAAALNVDQSSVSNWIRGKHGMSPLVALRVESLTRGEFKAVDLCPRVFGTDLSAA